ncbi:Protein CBG25933 [Caenorhabditis briggsae]|uniref:Protein CBG25933 n=1 Tax=Caenorhabditis briggsae TaxID=6238 RepID=B6IK65_CAEBR|nr:Protein CBG25933 [Caenorhabditis briggsae]CAS00295.1 Protein CBG25933 [Caenorhabditis briggsae]
MEQFVKGLPYPYEEACKEIVRRRNSYESADKLVRHAIHVQLLQTYHFDQQNGILVNCKECSIHLAWKLYKSKLGVEDTDNWEAKINL